jgi:lysozyme family protein
MANFEPIVAWVIYQEDDHRAPGKIVNLNDGAGLTRLGLTQRWHQQDLPMDYFSIMPFKDAVAAAKAVYRKTWNQIDGDLINSDTVAAPLMSFSVNDNPLIASKALQRVLGINIDGHIGPQTLSELATKDPEIVARLFRAEWIGFYKQLVQIAPSKQQFLQGWINRVNFPYPTTENISIYL